MKNRIVWQTIALSILVLLIATSQTTAAQEIHKISGKIGTINGMAKASVSVDDTVFGSFTVTKSNGDKVTEVTVQLANGVTLTATDSTNCSLGLEVKKAVAAKYADIAFFGRVYDAIHKAKQEYERQRQ